MSALHNFFFKIWPETAKPFGLLGFFFIIKPCSVTREKCPLLMLLVTLVSSSIFINELSIFLGWGYCWKFPSAVEANRRFQRVYYSLAVWRFKPILSAGLRLHSHLSGGLRLRNYRAVAGNQKFSSRFSALACFCDGYSNRVRRLRRLSGNFILLKASLFNKGLPFRARPSHSGLPSVSPAM